MSKIKRLAGFLGLILLSQSDLISLHKQAKWRFIVKVAVSKVKTRLKGFSPKREQRLWKLFQISGRDFKVRAKMTIENF